MKVGIIGAGLIGEKRAKSILANGDQVVLISDTNISKAKILSQMVKGSTVANNNEIFEDNEIECIVIATTHNHLTKLSYRALSFGKHVLCEKPLGFNSVEIKKCVSLALKKNLIYKAGYNHRFHPAINQAKELFDKGKIGKLMYIRGVYGHGGRPGYEMEWRMDKKISGGGELIDQCAHLIDLSLWFMKDIPKDISAKIKTFFWPIKVEDNAFVLLKNKTSIATLHASWTEWKNKFRYEIFGTKGYLIIDGLGGSYGLEKLIVGKRIPGKAPKEIVREYDGLDKSWSLEWLNFKNSIKNHSKLIGSGQEGLDVLRIISKIYYKLE